MLISKIFRLLTGPNEITQPNDSSSKVAWALFSIVGVFSWWKPNAILMAVTFLAAYFILIWRKDEQKTAMCFCVLGYMSINALFVVHHTVELYTDPALYIANRLWYAVGIALFAKHLIDKYIVKEVHSGRATVLGFLCLSVAFAFFAHEHAEKLKSHEVECKTIVKNVCTVDGEQEEWYRTDHLVDDVFIGLGLCFLIAATEASGANRKREDASASEHG